MKIKILLRPLIPIFCALLMVNSHALSQTKVKSIVKNNMASLGDFEYDSYAEKQIIYGTKTKKDFFEIEVFEDMECKLVFCKTELPQEVGITIYDRNPSNKDRKIIYFDDSGKKDQYVCNFRPTKTGAYFIEYEIPPATAPNQKGSILVLIGVNEEPETPLATK